MTDNELPGVPFDSGFRYRPAGDGPLSADALRRVLDKIDSVEAARRHAAAESRTAHIG